tara:strand:+ start:1668 stop:1907 length:240 start_codon:yes stop_codon:yes gene_type:complete
MAKFLIKPREIVEGFTNLAKSKAGVYEDEIEKMFDSRISICHTCPSRSENNRCTECGCILAAKARSKTSDCPLGKWEKI